MRILFLVYHGFSDYSGISKKIHYQVKGLRENGHDVRLCYYGFAENGHRCRYVDGVILKDYGRNKLAAVRQYMSYGCIYDYCIREKIDFVYARSFMNANPWLANLFKKIQKVGVKAITEIPTYPYDSEFSPFIWKQPLRFVIDKWFRRYLYQYMDAMVTFSDSEMIFGKRTIRISNGVDFDSIPLHKFIPPSDNSIHMIGVAEVHIWHGFDRLIAGIGEYYKNSPNPRQVFFHIVGGVHPYQRYRANQFHPGMQAIIDKYGIQDNIIFHGQLFGKELDKIFNLSCFAIGSLGRHRCGITVIKTLKNREYATRGIPFIYSEQDCDFDDQSYVLKAPADETPIDIQKIIDYISHFTMKPEEIRKTVEHLAWKIQMQKVVDQVMDY